MAAHLARIHGTEEDKVNCPFYFKIGSCRHGDRCSRLHHKPAFSPTLLIKHLYRHPQRLAELQQAATAGTAIVDEEQAQEDFLVFFEDLYMEFAKFGPLDALHVCDNLGDHMIGHVYIKYMDEEDAADALAVMNQRYYDGRQMQVEYSPVQNFQEARCRDFDEGHCSRGGFCNFMHVKPVPLALIRSLEEDAAEDRRRRQNGGSSGNGNSKSSRSSSSRKESSSNGTKEYRDRDRDHHRPSSSSSKRRKRDHREESPSSSVDSSSRNDHRRSGGSSSSSHHKRRKSSSSRHHHRSRSRSVSSSRSRS